LQPENRSLGQMWSYYIVSFMGMTVSTDFSFKISEFSILESDKTSRKIIIANLFNRQPALALA